MIELWINQTWRCRKSGMELRVASFGTKTVTLDMLPKLLAKQQMTHAELERDWELVKEGWP